MTYKLYIVLYCYELLNQYREYLDNTFEILVNMNLYICNLYL